MKYLKITTPDINNGTGCRVTLWLPGCPWKCEGCHNEWTHEYNQGYEFTPQVLFDLFFHLSQPYIAGLTISGGDPLAQSNETLDELLELVKNFHQVFKETKNIWVYTGYKIEELNDKQKEILKYCDVLVDGKFEIDKRDITLPFRGSSNQRIINLKEYFNKNI